MDEYQRVMNQVKQEKYEGDTMTGSSAGSMKIKQMKVALVKQPDADEEPELFSKKHWERRYSLYNRF